MPIAVDETADDCSAEPDTDVGKMDLLAAAGIGLVAVSGPGPGSASLDVGAFVVNVAAPPGQPRRSRKAREVDDPALQCTNTDSAVLDDSRFDCEDFASILGGIRSPSFVQRTCGSFSDSFDDDDFSVFEMCCCCGGGVCEMPGSTGSADAGATTTTDRTEQQVACAALTSCSSCVGAFPALACSWSSDGTSADGICYADGIDPATSGQYCQLPPGQDSFCTTNPAMCANLPVPVDTPAAAPVVCTQPNLTLRVPADTWEDWSGGQQDNTLYADFFGALDDGGNFSDGGEATSGEFLQTTHCTAQGDCAPQGDLFCAYLALADGIGNTTRLVALATAVAAPTPGTSGGYSVACGVNQSDPFLDAFLRRYGPRVSTTTPEPLRYRVVVFYRSQSQVADEHVDDVIAALGEYADCIPPRFVQDDLADRFFNGYSVYRHGYMDDPSRVDDSPGGTSPIDTSPITSVPPAVGGDGGASGRQTSWTVVLATLALAISI